MVFLRCLGIAACAPALLACQSPPTQGGTMAPVSAPPATSVQPVINIATPPPSSPAQATSLELTHDRRCPGMEQARSVRVSSMSGNLGVVDEAGEARLVPLAPARIAAFAEALRKAKIAGLASSPREGGAPGPCTLTLHVALDGWVKDIEESPASQVNDPAAWKEVLALIDALASSEI